MLPAFDPFASMGLSWNLKRLSGRCMLNVAWHALLFELPSCRPVQSRDASANKYASSARRGKIPYGVQTLAVTYPYAGQTGHAAGQRELSAAAAATSGTCGNPGMLAGAQSQLQSSARALVPQLGWWALESETPGWHEQALQ